MHPGYHRAVDPAAETVRERADAMPDCGDVRVRRAEEGDQALEGGLAEDAQSVGAVDRGLHGVVPAERREDGFEVVVEGEVVPDERLVGPPDIEGAADEAEPERPVSDDPVPPAGPTLPAEGLPAPEGRVEVEGLGLGEQNGLSRRRTPVRGAGP
jgi:hypothetical protein